MQCDIIKIGNLVRNKVRFVLLKGVFTVFASFVFSFVMVNHYAHCQFIIMLFNSDAYNDHTENKIEGEGVKLCPCPFNIILGWYELI